MERPILFSAPMVRAILEGRKTQTRRVIKPQPYLDECGNACWKNSNYGQSPSGQPHFEILASPIPWNKTKRVLCPYGKPGDRLWVREAFAVHPSQCTTIYRADWAGSTALPDGDIIKWKPPIHMPRWASRITLEITDIRVERLQDITEADALSEGIQKLPATGRFVVTKGDQYLGLTSGSAKNMFQLLWETINGPESWEQNPFVWVIEFKVDNQSEGA